MSNQINLNHMAAFLVEKLLRVEAAKVAILDNLDEELLADIKSEWAREIEAAFETVVTAARDHWREKTEKELSTSAHRAVNALAMCSEDDLRMAIADLSPRHISILEKLIATLRHHD